MNDDAELFHRAADIFADALEVPPTERAAFVDEKCAGDPALRREVLSLLASDDPAFLKTALSPAEVLEESNPERIGPYRILETIGEGGFGRVYLAEQESPTKRVALKVLYRSAVSPRALRLFELEPELLARLKHPAIAEVYRSGVERGVPYFALEYVDGETLTDYATKHALSVRAKLELFLKVCGAVEHAHQRGIIHRDLKPANILVDGAGNPKVLDFGIARVMDVDGEAPTRVTEPGQILGTVAYMSPEQARGEVDEIDTRADVYALGVILFELLSGELPHDLSRDLPLVQQLHVVTSLPPRKLSSLGRFADDLVTIVSKVTAEKNRRYTNVSALRSDLRCFLDHKPIEARPASAAYQLRRFLRRNWIASSALTAVLVALSAGLTASLLAQGRAERSFRRAWDAVGDFFTETSQSRELLRGTPGTLRTRAALLEKARQYYEDFARERESDAAYESELAKAHFRLGVIYRDFDEEVKARGHLEEAIRVQRRISDATPSDTASVELARSLNVLAQEQVRSGDLRSGMASYTDAIDTLAKRIERGSRDLSAWHLLASLRTNLAHVLAQKGDFDTSRTIYEKALSDWTRIENSNHDHSEVQREHAKALNQTGSLHARSGDQKRAGEFYAEAHALRVKVLEKSPDDPQSREELAASLSNLAKHHSSLGESQIALDLQAQAVKECKSLAAENPLVARYREQYAISLNNLAAYVPDPENALAAQEAALAVWRKLSSSRPDHHLYELGEAASLRGIAEAKGKQGDLEAARDGFEQARTLLEKHRTQVQASPDLLTDLALVEFNLGVIFSDSERFEEARSHFEAASSCYQQAIAISPEEFDAQLGRARCESSIATTFLFEDELEQARRHYETSLELLERIPPRDPQIVAQTRVAYDAQHNLSLCKIRGGDQRGALTALTAAIESANRFPPSEALPGDELGVLYSLRADAHAALGQKDDATRDFELATSVSTGSARLERELERAKWLASLGSHREAKEILLTLVFEFEDGAQFYSASCAFASCADAARRVGDASAEEEHIAAAVSLLEICLESGSLEEKDSRNVLRDDRDLDPIREHRLFKAFLAQLKERYPDN